LGTLRDARLRIREWGWLAVPTYSYIGRV
jgi:hypothetical protein